MPMAPSGTRPISTWRRLSISHSSEPMPMPIENTTSSSEATCSLPCSTSLAKAGELAQEHRAEEPHPADAQQRAEHHDVAVRQLQVAPGLGERVPVDDQARVGGRRARDELRHRAPMHRRQHAGDGHVGVADPGIATSSPPTTLPSRMATKVPISTMPLPPVSSRSLSTCGR
jgi:hypothetical protein